MESNLCFGIIIIIIIIIIIFFTIYYFNNCNNNCNNNKNNFRCTSLNLNDTCIYGTACAQYGQPGQSSCSRSDGGDTCQGHGIYKSFNRLHCHK